MTASPATELTEVVLRPVRGHHAFEGCVERLGTAIRLGVYPHGSALPSERELADRLAVSRATLREAIAALRTAGLVRTSRGRGGGSVVAYRPDPPSAGAAAGLADRSPQLQDMLVFRRVVEPGACHVAAGRQLTVEQRDFLTCAQQEVAAATDPAAHRQADSRFHLAIATLTGSPAVIRAVTEAQAAVHEMLSAIPVLEVNIEHSNQQHRAIVQAILKGDAVKARRVMENHCDDTAALLRGLIA